MSIPSISLGTYYITMTKRGEHQVLSDFEGKNLLNWIRRFLRSRDLRRPRDGGLARYRVAYSRFDDASTVYGVVECGQSGFGSNFIDVESGTTEFRRRPRNAEMIPLYFQFYVPNGSQVGILVLQRFGQQSPYRFFSEELRPSFAHTCDGFTLHMQPHVPKSVVQRLVQGYVSEVKFIQYTAPKGLENVVKHHGLVAEDVYFETKIVAKKKRRIAVGRLFSRAIGGVANRTEVNMPSEWEGIGDEVRITIRSNGKARTLSLQGGRELTPYEDYSDRCERDDDKQPLLESIHKLANEMVHDVRDDIGITYVK